MVDHEPLQQFTFRGIARDRGGPKVGPLTEMQN